MIPTRPKTTWILVACLAALPACQNKSATSDKTDEAKSADAGPARPSGVDKTIVEAVEQAAAGIPAPGAAPSGPPANGVFASAALADKEVAPGAPPKVTVGNAGSDPKIKLMGYRPGKPITGQLEIAYQTGPRSALPTIDLGISIDVPAPKSAADAPAVPAEGTAKITSASPSKDQPGELPPGTAAQIAKMKGGKFKVQMLPEGGGRIVSAELPKEGEESLGLVARSAGESLAIALLPYPVEPVGAGGFWMVTSRESYAGLDVVAYRMVKLDKIEGDHAVLSITTKRYVAGGKLEFPGLPPHKMQEFNGDQNGQIVRLTAGPSVQGELSDVVMAKLSGTEAAQQGQQMGIQLQVHTRLSFK